MSLLPSRDGICCCLGWGRESNADNALRALVFVTKASLRRQHPAEQGWRGTSSSSCARSSSLCLCVVWHAFPRHGGSQESQPANRFSFTSSTNNASHLPSPLPLTPPALFSLVFVHLSVWIMAWITWASECHTKAVGTSALQRAGFVGEGWTEKLNLIVSNWILP